MLFAMMCGSPALKDKRLRVQNVNNSTVEVFMTLCLKTSVQLIVSKKNYF